MTIIDKLLGRKPKRHPREVLARAMMHVDDDHPIAVAASQALRDAVSGEPWKMRPDPEAISNPSVQLAHLQGYLDATIRKVRDHIDIKSQKLGGVVRSADTTFDKLSDLSSLHEQWLRLEPQFVELTRLRQLAFDTIKKHHRGVLKDVEDPKTAALGELAK